MTAQKLFTIRTVSLNEIQDFTIRALILNFMSGKIEQIFKLLSQARL